MSIRFHHELLFESPTVRLVEIRWQASERRPTPEHAFDDPEITLMRRGIFVKQHGRREAVCDPNTVLFIDGREPYRMAHPVDGRCVCTALYLAPGAPDLGPSRP